MMPCQRGLQRSCLQGSSPFARDACLTAATVDNVVRCARAPCTRGRREALSQRQRCRYDNLLFMYAEALSALFARSPRIKPAYRPRVSEQSARQRAFAALKTIEHAHLFDCQLRLLQQRSDRR